MTTSDIDKVKEAIALLQTVGGSFKSLATEAQRLLDEQEQAQPTTFDRTPVLLTETPYVKIRRKGFLARTLRDVLYGIFKEIYETTGEVTIISQPCPGPGEPLFWKGSVHKNKGKWAYCYFDVQYYVSEKANMMLIDLIHERLPKDRPVISVNMQMFLGYNVSWITGDDTGQHDDHLHDRCEGVIK